jgi:hypothetical protein
LTAGVTSGYSYYANHTSAYSFLFSQINGANTVAFDNSSGNLQIYTGNSLRLTIAPTGAATFSSSVTAVGATISGTTALASTGGTSQMRIDRSGSVARIQNYDTGSAANISLAYDGGNVGIGTSSPSSLLTVAGDSALAWTSAVTHLRISRSGSLARFQNYDGGSVANIALNWEGGNVLIGTTTDNGNRLRVNGTVDFLSGTNNTTYLRVGNNSARQLLFSNFNVNIASSNAGHRLNASDSSGAIALATAGTDRLYINSSGNVLIGTTDDSGNRLQVNGDISMRDGSIVKNTAVVSNLGFVEVNLNTTATFSGFIFVNNIRTSDPLIRSQNAYFVSGRDGGGGISNAGGTIYGGGATFSLTIRAGGVIRATNTSGNECSISIQFFGGTGI